MTFIHTPGEGVVWGSVGPLEPSGQDYYPLKTSHLCSQLWCWMFFFINTSLHVSLIRAKKAFSHLIFVAVILSVVSLLLIAFSHLAFICVGE